MGQPEQATVRTEAHFIRTQRELITQNWWPMVPALPVIRI